MMAGGDDGTDKASRTLARRPTIRPRAVTPPRSADPRTRTPARTLPPVSLPSARVTEASRMLSSVNRPALLLVADASDQFEVALHHSERANVTALSTTWRAPRTIALAVVTVSTTVLAILAFVVFGASARPNEHPKTSAISGRAAATSTSTSVAAAHAAAVTKAEQPGAPSIPVFDVKSLPPASRGK